MLMTNSTVATAICSNRIHTARPAGSPNAKKRAMNGMHAPITPAAAKASTSQPRHELSGFDTLDST